MDVRSRIFMILSRLMAVGVLVIDWSYGVWFGCLMTGIVVGLVSSDVVVVVVVIIGVLSCISLLQASPNTYDG